MAKKIGRWDLQVGEWVKFSTTTPLEDLSEGQKQLYQDSRIFLVVTREDCIFDTCRCYLIDENGKSYDYCPRVNSLGYVNLSNNNISALSDKEVECAYGKEKMLTVYQAAKIQLGKMSDYFSKYPARKLNVDAKLGEEKVEETLSVKAL